MRNLALFLLFGLSAAVVIAVGSGTLLPPQAVGNGGVTVWQPNPQKIPAISDRHFASGSAQGQTAGGTAEIATAIRLNSRSAAFVQSGV